MAVGKVPEIEVNELVALPPEVLVNKVLIVPPEHVALDPSTQVPEQPWIEMPVGDALADV